VRRSKGKDARAAGQAAGNGHLRSVRRLLPTALVLLGAVVLVGAGLLMAASRSPPAPQTLDERTQRIASDLGCVTCLNLSVADSPAGTARAMRAEIRRRLRGGDTPDEIRAFFVRKYGDKILLSPRSLFPWLAPGLALVVGIGLLAWGPWRRRPEGSPADLRLSPAERARIRRELEALEEPD
jgi:cytochrome c-type biogenesis protein CcmH